MNFREKNKHLRDLLAPNHAEKDIVLLEKVDPRNDMLDSFKHAPVRHAERILYILLDFATADEIRNNRREFELLQQKERELKEEAERLAAEETELEKEELEDQVSELEEAVDELETRNTELETQLEEEKKSESMPVAKAVNSKRKTSTRKSTGKTLKTKTSR